MLTGNISDLAGAVARELKTVKASINALTPLPIRVGDRTPAPPESRHLMIFSTIDKVPLFWNGTFWDSFSHPRKSRSILSRVSEFLTKMVNGGKIPGID